MARIVNVLISIEFLQQMITTGWKVPRDDHVASIECINGLPEGAQLVHSFYDTHYNLAVLTFEHESLYDVIPGSAVPRITPEFREHYS